MFPVGGTATQFLLNRGLRVPQDVSLICCNRAPYFSHGKENTRQAMIDAEFIEARTVGPVAK